MTPPFRAAYASALAAHRHEETEASLRVAYELGRDAVNRGLSVLDLAVAHQEALLTELAGASPDAAARDIARAAGDFFLESLSAFEMVQRGLGEARRAAALARRRTELSRRLSSLLADASLARDAHDSLEEMLQLVAEQAREVVGGDCCVATVTLEGLPRRAEAASYDEDDRRWPAFVRWLDLFAIYPLIRRSGGSVRMTGEQLARLPPFRTAPGERVVEGWLGASLTTLDGGELGAIQAFDAQGRPFTDEDEAALVHLAQVASAAVDRALLYHDGR